MARKRAAIWAHNQGWRRLTWTLALLVCVALSSAQPSFLATFLKFYKPAPSSDIVKAGCRLCHGAHIPEDKNPYGRSLMRLINKTDERVLTEDILIAVEKEDSDGDGYTNIEEIVSGTLPGGPKSHPKVHPTNLPKRQRKPSRKRFLVYGAIGIVVLVVVGLIVKGILGARKNKDAGDQDSAE